MQNIRVNHVLQRLEFFFNVSIVCTWIWSPVQYVYFLSFVFLDWIPIRNIWKNTGEDKRMELIGKQA